MENSNWKTPRTLNKVERYEDQIHYDYIGAPGGEEWPIPNTWEVDAGVYGIIRGVDYPADKKISISQIEENFHKQANIELEKYYVGNTFNAQAAIQDGVPTSVAIKHMLDKKEEIKDSRTYSEQLEDKYQEQLARELSTYNEWLLKQMSNKGCGRTGGGLYTELNVTTPTGSATMYYPKGEEPKTMKDLVDDYSKLSNVNINNGQDSTFSFNNSCKEKPAPIIKKAAENKTYRPLPDCLTIKESSIDGLGLFATVDIDKDVTLGITHHYIDVGFKDELIRTPLSGFLNHSPNPNATIEEFENGKGRDHTYKNYKLITLRPASLGEEIFVDYRVALCGLSGYDGAEFLKEEQKENPEDIVYENHVGTKYYYNPKMGKYETSNPLRTGGQSYPIFFLPEDAEKYLKRVKE